MEFKVQYLDQTRRLIFGKLEHLKELQQAAKQSFKSLPAQFYFTIGSHQGPLLDQSELDQLKGVKKMKIQLFVQELRDVQPQLIEIKSESSFLNLNQSEILEVGDIHLSDVSSNIPPRSDISMFLLSQPEQNHSESKADKIEEKPPKQMHSLCADEEGERKQRIIAEELQNDEKQLLKEMEILGIKQKLPNSQMIKEKQNGDMNQPPKRPLCSYFKFSNERRKEKKCSIIEITNMWKELDTKEKQKYEAQYRIELEEYRKKKSAWESRENQPQKNEQIQKKVKKDEVIFDFLQCDICNSYPFKGPAYKCLVCKNFDICQNCEATFHHFHPTLKMTKPEHYPSKLTVSFPHDAREKMNEQLQKEREEIKEMKKLELRGRPEPRMQQVDPESLSSKKVQAPNFLSSMLGGWFK